MDDEIVRLRDLQIKRFDMATMDLARKRKQEQQAKGAVKKAEFELETQKTNERTQIDSLYEDIKCRSVKVKSLHKMADKTKLIKQYTLSLATAVVERENEYTLAQEHTLTAKKYLQLRQVKVEKYQYLNEAYIR